MENGSRQEKYTGYTPPIRTGKGNGLAPVESTDKKKASPVLKNALMKAESLSSEVEVSASNILAVQVMMGDFRALKEILAASWQASSNGKIYWCASMPGHKLSLVNGILHIDNVPADIALEKLLVK